MSLIIRLSTTDQGQDPDQRKLREGGTAAGEAQHSPGQACVRLHVVCGGADAERGRRTPAWGGGGHTAGGQQVH